MVYRRDSGCLRDFPCTPPSLLGASFVTRNFPGDVCGDASRVSPVEGIFFALSSYFSSLTFSHRDTITVPFSSHGASKHHSFETLLIVLKQANVATRIRIWWSLVEEFTRILDVPVYDPVPNISTVFPLPFPVGARGGRKTHEEIDWDVSPSETDIKTVWGGRGSGIRIRVSGREITHGVGRYKGRAWSREQDSSKDRDEKNRLHRRRGKGRGKSSG